MMPSWKVNLHHFIADLAAQGDLLAKYAKDEPQIAFLLHHCFFKKVDHLLRTLPPGVFQAHIIAPFSDVLKRVVLAILNSNELKAITWQQINLRIDARNSFPSSRQ